MLCRACALALEAPAAVERVRASAIRTHLVAALDDWMWSKLHLIKRDQKVLELGARVPRVVRL